MGFSAVAMTTNCRPSLVRPYNVALTMLRYATASSPRCLDLAHIIDVSLDKLSDRYPYRMGKVMAQCCVVTDKQYQLPS